MKCNYILVLLIFLFVIYVKTETEFNITAISGCTYQINPSGPYQQLVDGNIHKYWYAPQCSFEGQDNIYYCYFKTDKPVNVTGYKITLADDADDEEDSNPTKWYLKGKAKENDEWVEMHSKYEPMDSNLEPNKNFSYVVTTPGLFQYFVYIVTQLYDEDEDSINLGELWLLTPCANDKLASEKGCTCGKSVCNVGLLCKDGACLSSCPKDSKVNDKCFCSLTNICSKDQLCDPNNTCISSCPGPSEGIYQQHQKTASVIQTQTFAIKGKSAITKNAFLLVQPMLQHQKTDASVNQTFAIKDNYAKMVIV